ncbi:acylphosphatase [Nocardioides scoriae]|uniref:Acylphosphatase n=1 Tax=Nocardioides scoriae TaxID=642780 RepID=A0A1H1WQY7_9ACTN|nr:acylphosphatase [Nocardioides scoriae]SDS99667.1 acylphosphatase [Nocardioides scoriae]
MRAVEVLVTGKVQGVAFRAYAAREADRLGVAGWVRNRSDGTVHALVEGEEEAVESMLAWLRRGSPSARVHHLAVVDTDPDDLVGFVVEP